MARIYGLDWYSLIEVLTPFIKGLNKLLEIVINVVKEIGKIYTMITGKAVVVESTTIYLMLTQTWQIHQKMQQVDKEISPKE